MSLSSSVASHLPPNLPPEVLANGVSVTGGLGSAFGETVVLWLDGGPVVFTREDTLGPFSRAALSKQAPLSLEEEGVSRVLRVRLADGDEVTLEPGYFEATELRRLLSGETTSSGAPSSGGYSSSNYSTSYQSGDYSSSSYGTSSYSSSSYGTSSYGSASDRDAEYSSSSYGSGSSPHMFTPSYSDATDAADEADDNRVTRAVTSASVASASVSSRASAASHSVASSAVASSAVASRAVASSVVVGSPVIAASGSAGGSHEREARVLSKPASHSSAKDLFNDLPSPYTDTRKTRSPYADAARADSPYDHDHSKKDYDHAARPYADAKNAKSPYDLDAERHAFDADPERHAFDADPDRHAFDGDPERHAFDADPDRHAFDADPERHAFDADPERHAFDADGPPPRPSAGMSAFEIDDEVKRVVRDEGRFSAIQRYRKLTGAGLNEARTAVDNLMRPSGLPHLSGTSMVAEEPKNSGARFFWAVVGLFVLGWLMENC